MSRARWVGACRGRLRAGKGRQTDDEAANDVACCLAVVRLPSVGSDVLLTAFAPARVGARSAAAAHAGAGVKIGADETAEAILREALATAEVRDWGLFG